MTPMVVFRPLEFAFVSDNTWGVDIVYHYYSTN